MKKIYTLFTCFFIIIFINAQTKFNINSNSDELKEEISSQELSKKSFSKSAKRAIPFSLNSAIKNHQSLKIGDIIQLELFNDKNFESIIQSKSTNYKGITSIVVKLNEFNFAFGYIILSENSFLISIDIPELNEKYTTRKNGSSDTIFLIQINEALSENRDCGNTSTSLKGNRQTNTETSNDLKLFNESGTCDIIPSVDDPATIDIMVVYTPAAETWSNDNEGSIDNTIALAMTKANLVATNNNLGITFVLAYSGLVNYVENTAGADLNALRSDSDGIIDEVHTLRKTNDADLVALFSYLPGDGIGGIASLLTRRFGNSPGGFSNTKVNTVSSTYNFIHEIGHNFGADHYRNQNSSAGPTQWKDWPENDWSSGWRFQGSDTNMYGTVMTYTSPSLYADGLPTSTIGYFSEPDYIYLGTAAGDATQADNARTLTETKHYIARYSETAQYCTANVSSPTAFYFTNVTMGTINHTSVESLYSDVSSLATCMELGSTQSFSAQVFNSASTNRLKIWIDWNDDKSFDEGTELVYASNTGLATYTTDITAPSAETLGEKRMRIRVYDPASPIPNTTPCGNSFFGEIEDYTINLIEPLSVDEINLASIRIHPNPFNQQISIHLPLSFGDENFEISLFDLNGRVVFKNAYSSVNGRIDLENLESLPQGLFLIKITNNQKGNSVVKKLLKY